MVRSVFLPTVFMFMAITTLIEHWYFWGRHDLSSSILGWDQHQLQQQHQAAESIGTAADTGSNNINNNAWPSLDLPPPPTPQIQGRTTTSATDGMNNNNSMGAATTGGSSSDYSPRSSAEMASEMLLKEMVQKTVSQETQALTDKIRQLEEQLQSQRTTYEQHDDDTFNGNNLNNNQAVTTTTSESSTTMQTNNNNNNPNMVEQKGSTTTTAEEEEEETSLSGTSDFFDSVYLHSSEKERLELNFGSFFDARDASGKLGYIADPTSLRRNLKIFLTTSKRNNNNNKPAATTESAAAAATTRYYHVMENYEIHHHRISSTPPPTMTVSTTPPAATSAGANSNNTNVNNNKNTLQQASPPPTPPPPPPPPKLDMKTTCLLGGGAGIERPSGFKLLTQKIEIAPQRRRSSKQQRPKLLCMMYTYDKNFERARAGALSWGYKCDGFLAFSTETIASLGMVDLVHPGPEQYENMWQKIRSIWGYIGLHYLEDYDYYHIAGDDLYIIVENLRHFILRRLEPQQDQPVITGAHAKVWEEIDGVDYIIGGPGYTMNRVALQQFVTVGLNNTHGCFNDKKAIEEDQLMSKCFQHKLKIQLTDSHDLLTGEQLFHHVGADRVYDDLTNGTKYIHRAKRYWSKLPHPTIPNRTIGKKEGFDAAHKHSIAFHYLKTPEFFARYTAILYGLCPTWTPLGLSLFQSKNQQQQSQQQSQQQQ